MASTAKSGSQGISSNVKMRLQKWVGRAVSVGKAKPERQQAQLGSNDTNYAHQIETAALRQTSLPIPVFKKNTSASYPDSLSVPDAGETIGSNERSIPSSMPHDMRVYSSTGNLGSAELARGAENTGKRSGNQWGQNVSRDSSNKKQKARSTDDLRAGEDQTDTKCHDEGIHNKRALLKANNLKRTRQTSIESIETLSSESSERAAPLEEPNNEDEKFAGDDVEKLSEQINARLQKWAYLAQEKRERRPSEESSGSSSDCADGPPSIQAKEILELESALKELVGNATNNVRTRRRSRCDLVDGVSSANASGQRSRKSSGQENCSSPDVTFAGRAGEEVELCETDAGCSESEEAQKRSLDTTGLTSKRERSDGEEIRAAGPQDEPEESIGGEVAKSSNEPHVRHGKVCSTNSASSSESNISSEHKQAKTPVSSVPSSPSDGGLRFTIDVCEDIPNIATSDQKHYPQNEMSEMARNSKKGELSSANEESKDSSSQENGGSRVRFEAEDDLISKTRPKGPDQPSTADIKTQSIPEDANISPVGSHEMGPPRRPCIMKRRSVPNSVYSLKMRADVRESMRQFLNFNDADLSEFAVECVRHANKKKQRLRKKNSAGVEESCSGSDDNASDRTAGTSSSLCELSNLSQSPLDEEPLNEGRKFTNNAEEAGMILTSVGARNAGSVSHSEDALRPQRLYKFPSLPMFYCPEATDDNAIKDSSRRSNRALSLHNVKQDIRKSNSITDLHNEGKNASDSKALTRNSVTSPNLQAVFFHGDVPMRDKSDKAAKLKRNFLRPRSWLGKPKDENGNIQRSDKKLSTKSKSKELITVSMEALI